jgi:hypothetical protein
LLFAENELKLSILQGDGRPLKDHLKAAARQLGRDYAPDYECPLEVFYIWEYFIELCRSKNNGAILYSDIFAWCKLKRIQLSEYELNIIFNLLDLINGR